MQIELFGSGIETLTPTVLALPAGTERHIISDGVRGTEETIALMQKMVNSYKRNDDIRALCGRVIANCKPKDYFDYCKKCYEWVRDNIKYAYDPHLVEYIESPKRLLKNRIGDCDSMDMLLASMFEQLGFACQFVTIMADASRPGEFTHVYTRVMIPKVGWVVADPIMPEKWFGWEPPYPQGKRYWHSSADELNTPLDTSDSLQIGPGQTGPDGTGSGMSGMSGLGDIGRGHHHSGRGWGGRGGNWGWGGGDDVYVLPIAVPVVAGQMFSPDQFSIVSDPMPQQFENPADDQSVGISGLGWEWSDVGKAVLGPAAVVSDYFGGKTVTQQTVSQAQTPEDKRSAYIAVGTTDEARNTLAKKWDSYVSSGGTIYQDGTKINPADRPKKPEEENFISYGLRKSVEAASKAVSDTARDVVKGETEKFIPVLVVGLVGLLALRLVFK